MRRQTPLGISILLQQHVIWGIKWSERINPAPHRQEPSLFASPQVSGTLHLVHSIQLCHTGFSSGVSLSNGFTLSPGTEPQKSVLPATLEELFFLLRGCQWTYLRAAVLIFLNRLLYRLTQMMDSRGGGACMVVAHACTPKPYYFPSTSSCVDVPQVVVHLHCDSASQTGPISIVQGTH